MHTRQKPNGLGELGLAAAVAHEVRRVLTPACAYAELALEDPHLQADANRALKSLLSAADDVQAILTDLTTVPSKEDCCALLEQVRATLGSAGTVTGSGGLEVALTPARLGVLLSNLIGNAKRATRDGGAISVRCRSTGKTITIDVEDTGQGMTPEQAARATDPFVSFSASSGLGLAICRYLVQQAGGSLRIRSSPGRGTCVSLELPAATQSSAKAA